MNIWQGVYADFASVPREGPGFDGPEWVEILARRLEDARAGPGRPIVPVYMLPAVAALAPGAGPLRILDFGGGVGATFLGLAAALTEATELEYHVVDSAAVCARGRALHEGEASSISTRTCPGPGSIARTRPTSSISAARCNTSRIGAACCPS